VSRSSPEALSIKAAWIQTSNVLGGQGAGPDMLTGPLKSWTSCCVDLFHIDHHAPGRHHLRPPPSRKKQQPGLVVPAGRHAEQVQVGDASPDWEINFGLQNLQSDGLKKYNRWTTSSRAFGPLRLTSGTEEQGG
jgi:hypothetical protein